MEGLLKEEILGMRVCTAVYYGLHMLWWGLAEVKLNRKGGFPTLG